MADNVAVTPGTGATFATDDIGGIQYPRVKVTQGADGASVDVSSAAPLQVTLANGTVPSHAVTNAGTFATQVTSIAAGTNNIGDVDVLTLGGQSPAYGSGASSASTLRTVIASDSQNANGQATMANSAPVVIASDQSIIQTAPQPLATGGLSCIYFLDIDESPTSQQVKATAGCLYKLRITNRSTGVRYVKLYNATAASTTVGTTTPLDVIPVPGNATDYTVITESFGGQGLAFSTALTIAATTGFADNDTGAPGANDVIVSAYYK